MRIELGLPGRPESVARARAAIEQLDPPVGAAQREDLKLLVSEVVTNAIRHGNPAAGDQVRVSISSTPEQVRVEVVDAGPGFTVPDVDPDPERAGGWGLWLVEQLADRWGIRGQGGTCVWFEVAHR